MLIGILVEPLSLFIQDGRTPLFWSSFNGHTAVVELLLLNGADSTICHEVHVYYMCIICLTATIIYDADCCCSVVNTGIMLVVNCYACLACSCIFSKPFFGST